MRAQTIDCHSDVMIDVWRRRGEGERNVLARVHGPDYAAGNVVAAICTVGGDAAIQCPYGLDDAYRSTVAMLEALHADVAESEGAVAVVRTAAEIQACSERGTFAVVPAIEGAIPVEGDLAKLADLVDRGVRVVGLTWNTRNALAVGLDSGEGGLTELGREAVALLDERGALIDLSHAAPQTFWDVAGLSTAPLFVSHANAAAVHAHPRNLDDEQLAAVAASGGAVGIVFCPTFIGPQPVTLDDVFPHLEHFRRTVGDEHVLIGADFCDYALADMLADVIAHAGAIYDESTLHYPEGINSVRYMENVVSRLGDAGFDEAGARLVAAGNALRLLA
jgi:membrane dipeptidase